MQKLFGKPTKKEEPPQPEDGLKKYKSMDLTVKPAKLQRVSGQFGVCSSEFSLSLPAFVLVSPVHSSVRTSCRF